MEYGHAGQTSDKERPMLSLPTHRPPPPINFYAICPTGQVQQSPATGRIGAIDIPTDRQTNNA